MGDFPTPGEWMIAIATALTWGIVSRRMRWWIIAPIGGVLTVAVVRVYDLIVAAL